MALRLKTNSEKPDDPEPLMAPAGNSDPGDLLSEPYDFYVLSLAQAVEGKLPEKSLCGSRRVKFTDRSSGGKTWKEPHSISEAPRDGTMEETPGYTLFSSSADLKKALRRLAEIENQDPVRRREYEVRQLDVLGLGLTAWWLHEDRPGPRDLFIPLLPLTPLVYGGVYEEERFLQIVKEKAKACSGNGSSRGRVSP